MSKPKVVYVAGTRQNEGKTTLSLGLMAEFLRRGMKVGFIKPVGQQYVEAEGVKVDKDSLLLVRIFHFTGHLRDTSPVAVDRNFTRDYIDNPRPEALRREILDAFERVCEGKDIVVVEGTGHAGVGGVFDLSNAQVARLLGAPVVIVSSGGIGRPVDELILNKGVFDMEGVPIAGVVINKIREDKMPMIGDYVARSLAHHGMKFLGVMPLAPQLSLLTLRQVVRDLQARLLLGEQYLDNVIKHLAVGAMTARNAFKYIVPGSLVITGGDREDLLRAAVEACKSHEVSDPLLSGIIMTGGMLPEADLKDIVGDAGFPVLAHDWDSYSVAAAVHDLVAKIQLQDTAKHQLTIRMVQKHIDIDELLRVL